MGGRKGCRTACKQHHSMDRIVLICTHASISRSRLCLTQDSQGCLPDAEGAHNVLEEERSVERQRFEEQPRDHPTEAHNLGNAKRELHMTSKTPNTKHPQRSTAAVKGFRMAFAVLRCRCLVLTCDPLLQSTLRPETQPGCTPAISPTRPPSHLGKSTTPCKQDLKLHHTHTQKPPPGQDHYEMQPCPHLISLSMSSTAADSRSEAAFSRDCAASSALPSSCKPR